MEVQSRHQVDHQESPYTIVLNHLMLYSPHFIYIPYLFNKFPFVGHLGSSLIVILFWIYLDGQISQLDQNMFHLQNSFFSLCSGLRFVIQL